MGIDHFDNDRVTSRVIAEPQRRCRAPTRSFAHCHVGREGANPCLQQACIRLDHRTCGRAALEAPYLRCPRRHPPPSLAAEHLLRLAPSPHARGGRPPHGKRARRPHRRPACAPRPHACRAQRLGRPAPSRHQAAVRPPRAPVERREGGQVAERGRRAQARRARGPPPPSRGARATGRESQRARERAHSTASTPSTGACGKPQCEYSVYGRCARDVRQLLLVRARGARIQHTRECTGGRDLGLPHERGRAREVRGVPRSVGEGVLHGRREQVRRRLAGISRRSAALPLPLRRDCTGVPRGALAADGNCRARAPRHGHEKGASALRVGRCQAGSDVSQRRMGQLRLTRLRQYREEQVVSYCAVKVPYIYAWNKADCKAVSAREQVS